ncbi:MAG: hypothetical protein HUK01_07120 [Bacteroidaceae bacterium]|nr:hypothetical protein [Bacteroidaceae bacterium]
MSNIKELIRQLAQHGTSQSVFVGKVTAVDRQARTCDVEPIDEDAPVPAVNLQANQESGLGVVMTPRVGSYVVVAMLGGYASGVVVLTEDIERLDVKIGQKTVAVSEDGIVMNGGDMGGMVKIQELTQKLNNLENDINTLKDAMTGWVPVPQDGGAALKSAVSAWSGGRLTPSQRGDYEDENVKH